MLKNCYYLIQLFSKIFFFSIDASGNPVTQVVISVTDASGNSVTGNIVLQEINLKHTKIGSMEESNKLWYCIIINL